MATAKGKAPAQAKKPATKKPAASKAKTPAKGKGQGKGSTPTPKKMGRPSTYTPELAKTICLLISEGMSLRKVCEQETMPSKFAVLQWLARHDDFAAQYARAKEQCAEMMAEELLEIADDARNDWMEQHGEDGEVNGYKLNGEHVQRSKLRIDTRKWLMGKLKPKKYSEKLDLNHGVQEDNPLAQMLAHVQKRTLGPVEE